MSPDIITFEKSLERRLSEYVEILGARGNIPASGIYNEWYYYIESVLEPVGWQALWKISRRKCEEFKIEFPTLVLVMVKAVVFQELQAVVDIVAVQDDISLPEQHEVSLTRLYPTKQQENVTLDVNGTANCLDQLRFFFIHLWQPWDADDGNQDWLSSHLESRLQLYYDMQSGVVLHETGQRIRSLLHEARDVEHKIKAVEEWKNDTDEVDENTTLTMMKLQVRREEIKREIEILENPLMRNLVVKEKHEVAQAKRQNREYSKEACFVWLGGTIEEFICTLTKAKNFVEPDTYIKSCPLMQEALDQAIAGDTVILCPGIHGICSSGVLEEGGNIKGFLEPSATTIVARVASNVLLDWSGDVTLENLTIDARSVQMALSIRNGTVRLNNCRVLGFNASNTGILVLKDGNFEAKDCEFLNFGVGLVLEPGAQVSMTDCNIKCCKIGIKMCEEASIMLQRCKVSECSEYGIKMEIQQVEEGMEGRHVGSVVLLESFGKVKLSETTVEENKKSDVLIIQQQNNVVYESGDSGCITPEPDNDGQPSPHDEPFSFVGACDTSQHLHMF